MNLTLVNYLIRMIENPIIPGRMNEGSIFRYFEERYKKAKYFPFCNGTYDHDIFHWT